jgi:hypothetical protein
MIPRLARSQQGLKEETAMNGKRALIVLAVATAQGFLGAAPAAANDMDSGHGGEVGGSVVPCSLAGINPAHHPEIFGNPAVAASYGFVRAPDGIWHVQRSGVGAPASADNYASTTQKAPRHHRKTLKP